LVSSSPATTADSYFYHSDHLGSSSLITNKDGYLVQNIQYVPFGEVFVEERNASWSTPFKFNGKEQDEETGLCYYGARYYDPRTSVWISADPLAERFPNTSSYLYCFANPVKFIDPNVDLKQMGGAGKIYQDTYIYALSKGLNVKGAVISPALTQGPGVETGEKFLEDNYKQGDMVIIYGYSYGGDNAVSLAESVKKSGITINLLVTIDSSDGPLRGITVDTSIPDNVETAVNFFQTVASGNISKYLPRNGDNNNSSEDSSTDGTSNSPGSRGFPITSEGKAKIKNTVIQGESVTHGNIQTKAQKIIETTINKAIDNYDEL